VPSAIDTAWQGIEERVRDNWSTTPVAYPGVDFQPPTQAPHEWVRVTPIWGDADMSSMTTSGTNRIDGFLDIDLFGKQGTGYGTLRGYADTWRDLFDRVDVGTVQFQAASAPRIIDNSSGWLHLKVSVPFTVDETS